MLNDTPAMAPRGALLTYVVKEALPPEVRAATLHPYSSARLGRFAARADATSCFPWRRAADSRSLCSCASDNTTSRDL